MSAEVENAIDIALRDALGEDFEVDTDMLRDAVLHAQRAQSGVAGSLGLWQPRVWYGAGAGRS